MESSAEQSAVKKPPLQRAALAALMMSVIALLVWFLPSQKAHAIGLSVLLASLALVLLCYLLFCLTEKTKRGVRIVLRTLAALLSLLAMLAATVYSLAPAMLFYPHYDEASARALSVYPKAEVLSFSAGGRTVSGWLLRGADEKAPLVLYFGGNGENASTRVLKLIESGDAAAFSGCQFAFLDYPGYGLSSGRPSDASLRQMGLDAYDALAQRSDVDAKEIVLFGFSMGTGVANYVASARPAAGLMLMAPYADGYDLYNSMFPIFYGPLRLLVSFKMESVRFAESISLKPLLLASADDKMVPFASSERLSRAYPAGCEFVRMQGLGHNDFWGSKDVLSRVSQYLAEVIDHGA